MCRHQPYNKTNYKLTLIKQLNTKQNTVLYTSQLKIYGTSITKYYISSIKNTDIHSAMALLVWQYLNNMREIRS